MIRRLQASSAVHASSIAVSALLLAGCATTSADWRERYLEKEKDATDIGAKLSESQSAHSTAMAQLEEARARIRALEQENEGLKAGSGAAAAAPAPVAAAPDSAATNEAIDRFQKQGIDAHMTADGNIAIVLPSDITFAPGSKDLSAAGKKAVDSIAKELQGQFAGASVRVEGHTDADPIKKSKFKDNWELGAERSLTVVRFLVEDGKVSPERLVAASRGETVPLADNKSEKGKARNRRVEVVVLVPHDASMAK